MNGTVAPSWSSSTVLRTCPGPMDSSRAISVAMSNTRLAPPVPGMRVEERHARAPRSGQELAAHAAGDIGEAELAALELVGETRVIDAHQVEDGGMQVVDIDRVLSHVVAQVVRLADRNTGLDAAAGHPDGEGARVVVPAEELGAVPPLIPRRAA